MRWSIIFVTLLIFISPIYGLELDQAVDLAKANNPSILAAQKQWRMSRDKLAAISTWPEPQVELMYERIPQTGGSLNDSQMKMYGLSQMIPFPGKLSLKRRQGEAAAQAAEQQYLTKTWQVVTAVKKAYYSLFFIDQAIEINQENKELLAKFARIAEAKYVVAKASQHDVLKAQIQLELLADQLITLKQQRATAVARLNTLLNREPQTLITLPQNIAVAQPDLDLAKLEARAVQQRPEIKAAAFKVKQQAELLTLAKLDYLPDFKAKLLQREMPSGLDGWNASLMIDLPLWFWAKSSAVNAAGRANESAEARLREQTNQVRFEVQDAVVRVDSDARLVKLYQNSIVPKADQSLKAALIAYQADKIDFLSLLNSQKTWEDSKLKYFKSLTDLGQGLAELERIIGGMINEQI